MSDCVSCRARGSQRGEWLTRDPLLLFDKEATHASSFFEMCYIGWLHLLDFVFEFINVSAMSTCLGAQLSLAILFMFQVTRKSVKGIIELSFSHILSPVR